MNLVIRKDEAKEYWQTNGVTLSDTQMTRIDQALGFQLNNEWERSLKLLYPMTPGLYGLGSLINRDNNVFGISESTKTARFAYYNYLAKNGKMNAQCFLGKMYAEGDGIKQDIRKAIKYWQMAAEQGSPHAKQELLKLEAECNIPGDMTQDVRGYIEGLLTQRLEEQVKNGDPTAKFSLGMNLMQKGYDLPRALVLLQEAADAKVHGALAALADFLLADVKHSLSSASVATYLKQAALQEQHVKAAEWLGDKYAQDSVLDTEFVSYFPLVTISPLENAVKFYDIARTGSETAERRFHQIKADQGDKDSAFTVAQAYSNSKEPSEKALADKYFLIAAKKGHVDAAIQFTQHREKLYSNGDEADFAAGMKEALPFYKIAAEGGDDIAKLVIKAHSKNIVKAQDAAGVLDAAKSLVSGSAKGSAKFLYYESLWKKTHTKFLELAQEEGLYVVKPDLDKLYGSEH